MSKLVSEGELDTMTVPANTVFQVLYALMEQADTGDDQVAGVRMSFLDIDGVEKYLWIEMEAPDEWETI